MPEIRKDPVFGRWIIVAAERKDRPNEFRALAVGNTEYRCPFCAGNESMTPHETYSVPDGKGGWKLRVVPNKYPALCGDEPLQTVRDGIYERSNGPGMHEVVIETPDHNARTEDMMLNSVRSCLTIIRDRKANGNVRGKAIIIDSGYTKLSNWLASTIYMNMNAMYE